MRRGWGGIPVLANLQLDQPVLGVNECVDTLLR